MKKKEKTTIIAMKPQELHKAVADIEQKLADWLVTRYSKQSKNTREGRSFKRKIAYLKTVLRQKELAV